MRTPADKEIAFRFASHPTKRLAERWLAQLTFPPGSTAETVLPIEIVDGESKPIAAAVFEFAGRRLPVRNGKTSISYADFIRGKHEIALWLYRDGMPPIPGGLSFM